MDKPVIIKSTNSERLDKLKESGVKIIDFFDLQIEELAEVRNPSLRDNKERLALEKSKYKQEYQEKKVFCYYPWKNICVASLPEDLFFEVKTARNRDLITATEQAMFRRASIAIAGLSVGSNIARLCVLQGGPQKMNLADADVIGLSNLNRIVTDLDSIGKKKTRDLAEKLYQMDPYLDLVEFENGINKDNLDKFVYNDEGKVVDLIVEEMDDLGMKVALRETAFKNKIPLFSIADNGDGVIVDVERYDDGYDIKNFYKRMENIPAPGKEFTSQDIAKAITNFIGAKDVDVMMLESVSRVGKDLYSWPQLGGAAVLSGVVGAYVARHLVGQKSLASGRYIISLPTVFSMYGKKETELKNKLLNFFE